MSGPTSLEPGLSRFVHASRAPCQAVPGESNQETWVIDFFSMVVKANWVFVDIGANIGVLSPRYSACRFLLIDHRVARLSLCALIFLNCRLAVCVPVSGSIIPAAGCDDGLHIKQ
jgi:hypothetical protein